MKDVVTGGTDLSVLFCSFWSFLVFLLLPALLGSGLSRSAMVWLDPFCEPMLHGERFIWP